VMVDVNGSSLNQGGNKVVLRKKFSEFSRPFQSHNYTFPEVIATIFWQFVSI